MGVQVRVSIVLYCRRGLQVGSGGGSLELANRALVGWLNGSDEGGHGCNRTTALICAAHAAQSTTSIVVLINNLLKLVCLAEKSKNAELGLVRPGNAAPCLGTPKEVRAGMSLCRVYSSGRLAAKGPIFGMSSACIQVRADMRAARACVRVCVHACPGACPSVRPQ